MPNICCVPYCNSSYLRSVTPRAISLFSFPKDPILRKKWLLAIRRKGLTPKRDTRVCELHFSKECILTSTSYMVPETGVVISAKLGKKRLAPKAIPTIFNYPETALSERNTELKCNSKSYMDPVLVKKEVEALANEIESTRTNCKETETVHLKNSEEQVPYRLHQAEPVPTEDCKMDLVKDLIDKLSTAEKRNKELEDRIQAMTMQLEECTKENADLKEQNRLLESCLESHTCKSFSLDDIALCWILFTPFESGEAFTNEHLPGGRSERTRQKWCDFQPPIRLSSGTITS